MDQLPERITCYILSYLDVVSLSRCRRVCRDWLELLTKENELWKELYERSGDQTQDLKQIPCYYRKLVALQCSWNPQDCSDNITVKNEDTFTMQRNCKAQSTDGIRAKSGFLRGRHYWTVCWMGPNYGSAAVVGVATKDAPLHGEGYFALLGSNQQSWGWNIPGKMLTHNGTTVEYPSNKELQVLIILIKASPNIFFSPSPPNIVGFLTMLFRLSEK